MAIEKRWNDKAVEEILRLLRDEQLTLEQVGRQYGVSRERIRQVVKKAGISVREFRPKFDRSTSRVCRICATEYKSGEYQQHLEATGHERPRRKEPPGGVGDEIARRYLAGERVVDISRSVRNQSGKPVTFTQIYRYLQRRGIKPDRGAGRYKRTSDSIARMIQSQYENRERRRLGLPPTTMGKGNGWRAPE